MLKGCQNNLAVQDYTQETADQMLQIKTAHQSQLRAAFKRRIKMPYTPFVTSLTGVQPGKGRATKSPTPERCCPPPKLFKRAHVALWEGCESSEMETTCEHTPLGRAPCARQQADHQLTPCVKCSQGVWLVWEPNRTGGRKVPTLWKEPGTWCVCSLRRKNPTPENVLRNCLTRQIAFSLLSVLQFIWYEVNLAWASVNCKIARKSHFAHFPVSTDQGNYFWGREITTTADILLYQQPVTAR